ncbi:amidohydrolase family protein [Glacieibacterium frigidum]|uniref:Amidohydrolase family protein n=1 Tax=Glacieibacterium frigidum TaxID=2593303 RepID=A0A552UGZ0_9SPHN|nr:amidohydrolase family protein [Glacieibacterium frigidum]TRW17492.1 amidohydrolase family protein [Glacieibacterium frigidum]
MRVWMGLAAALIATAAQAADLKALVGGRLIDGNGGPPLANSVILVDGGRITAVGTVATLPVPAGAEVISTEGMDVLPGLWDMHVHLMLNGHADYVHWDKAYIQRWRNEIMPAGAAQLLLAGVTSARDLGGTLDDSIAVRDAVAAGRIPGPRLYVSGPFLQKKPYPGTEAFRWGIKDAADARAKVRQLKAAGVDIIKMVDQDELGEPTARALVDEAHKVGLKVVGHSHLPEEIRLGLRIGVDNFEHTGLGAAPRYPDDIMLLIEARAAEGRVRGSPLYWTPTISGLFNLNRLVANPEKLDDKCWTRGLKPDTIADIKASIAKPDALDYNQLTPKRKPTLDTKFAQLRKSGAILLIGTDSGIPMTFHCQSTWNELDVWVNKLGVPAMEAIQSATYWPAKFMGVEKTSGTVTPGRHADIIAVRGDVLETIALLQNVPFVMKGGVVYKRDGQPVEAALGAK